MLPVNTVWLDSPRLLLLKMLPLVNLQIKKWSILWDKLSEIYVIVNLFSCCLSKVSLPMPFALAGYLLIWSENRLILLQLRTTLILKKELEFSSKRNNLHCSSWSLSKSETWSYLSAQIQHLSLEEKLSASMEAGLLCEIEFFIWEQKKICCFLCFIFTINYCTTTFKVQRK